jgi:integrase
LIDRAHVALDVENPQPTRPGIDLFETWQDVEAVANEIDPPFCALIIFAAGTGARPGEWAALTRADLDLHGPRPSVTIRKRLTKDGKIENATKDGKHRRIPLRRKVVAALEAHPPRLDTRLLFPAAKGGLIDLHNFREDYWHPAMFSAGFVTDEGKPDRGPYALRHTYATWALRAGIPTFTLARRMGTSLEMIEQTYGHLAHDTEEWELDRLEAFDNGTDGRRVDAQGAKE